MNLKKRIILILGSCIMVLGLATSGVILASNRSSQKQGGALYKENIAPERVNIDEIPSYSSETDIETAYDNFLIDMISSGVENLITGISDCVIDITGLINESPEVHVRITVNDNFDHASENDIQAYIAQALDISVEDVKISYNK